MYLEETSRKRLKYVLFIILLFFLAIIIRMAYMSLLYHTGFALEKGRAVQVMNTDMMNEIKSEYNLKLTGFKQMTRDELIRQSAEDSSVLSLLALMNTACAKKCIGDSAAFIKLNKGYILYKESSGGNVVLEIRKENNEWIVRNN
ncbi:hypothetical protein ACFDTO_32405 [Microbacteriaceae bacterium 4G12]